MYDTSLESASDRIGQGAMLLSVVWGIVIALFNIPELIAGLTVFAFVAKSPWNIITGIVFWFIGTILVLWWASKEEDKLIRLYRDHYKEI